MTRKRIEDEFTHLPISRQRKYQLRMAREGRCTECGAPANASRCLEHLVRARDRQRKKLGLKRKYFSLSRREEERLKAEKRNQKVTARPAARSARSAAKKK